jgi:hypothetical protein
MIWDVETGRLLRTLRHDRPYERMDITGVGSIIEAQSITLLALGGVGQRTRARYKIVCQNAIWY